MIFLEDILTATEGQTHGPIFATEFANFCFDSRILQPGELFLAVRTEKADGHDYVQQVCRDGAAGVLCERGFDLSLYGVTCIVVPDTQAALRKWGRYILAKYQTEVIGVTGSTGKTTTKEAIATVLSASFSTFKNYASYNGRYGLPIALGQLRPDHELAVLEMACDGHGEIAELAQMAPPRVAVVTAVNPVHLDAFGTLDAIAAEKGRLVEALPQDGWAILNADDPRVEAMARRTRARTVSIGTDHQADFSASDVRVTRQGTALVAHAEGRRVPLSLPLIGRHHVYTALAALAVGRIYGLDLDVAAERLSTVERVPGRLSPLPGQNGSLILDDTYNASPAATLAGLDTLAVLDGRCRIAVLGDMWGLGSYEVEGHRQVGRRAAEVVDLLVSKGERARLIAEEALRCGLSRKQVVVTYTAEDAARAVSADLAPGDIVLVKGAMEARMEEVVTCLLADPSQAPRLLVRQDQAWQQIVVLRPDRPTWVEIDLGAIAHNVRRLKEMAGPGVKLMVTLKADAYGHGAVKVARTALNNGADWLGIACLPEAVTLREAGIDAPILILGYTPAWQARDVVRHGISATVFSLDVARALSRAGRALNSTARVHVKVDTGMGRLGLFPDQVLEFVQQIRELPNLLVEGIFTHFPIADTGGGWGQQYTRGQIGAFQSVLDDLQEQGITIPLGHAANSGALFQFPEARFTMVRPGIAVFGLDPSAEVRCPPDFRPALTWKTQVAQVKELPPGSYVGYGCAYTTQGTERIAVIPVGYADGFRRSPSHWGEVLVRGQRAPIVGRVCMDQTMISVSHIPGVRQGDEVVLIGAQGQERITVEEAAGRLGTINYEVVSEILARVPRVS